MAAIEETFGQSPKASLVTFQDADGIRHR